MPPLFPARSSGAVGPAGREGPAGTAPGMAGGALECGLPRVCRQGGGLERRRVVPGASGVLQRPHRDGGVMRAVDCYIVGALGT